MTKTRETLEEIFDCAKLAVEKRGTDLALLGVADLTSYTDYFLLVSAGSDRRVQTIADFIRRDMKEKGHTAIGQEGLKEGRWALLDFGSFIVHVFYEDLRPVFDLEGLWSDAARVELPSWVFEFEEKEEEL
jgi:ribosome-associated protein